MSLVDWVKRVQRKRTGFLRNKLALVETTKLATVIKWASTQIMKTSC